MRYYLLLIFFYFNLFATSYETIHNSGSSDNRLDLVFIGDRYFADEMVNYEKDVETIWSGMQNNYAFWNRYQNFVNIHRVDLVSALNNPEDIKDVNNSAFGLDFNLGYWDGWNDWLKCLSITKELNIQNECTTILTNRVFGLGTALDRSSTSLIYAAPWTSIVSHEIGHVLGMAGDEYQTTIQEYMYDYAFNMARSVSEAKQRWGHWIGYKDSFRGYEINEPYQKEGANYFKPTSYDGLMNNSNTGDFHAVNREQIILQLYKYVSPIDSHTETNSSVNNTHTLEINVVDPNVVDIAWIVDNKIVSSESTLQISQLNLSQDTLIYGCAWDNSLNTDYQEDDRGGWIRSDEHNRTFRILSWQFKTDNSIKQIHSQLDNKDHLSLILGTTIAKQYFDQELLSKSTGPDASNARLSGNSQEAEEEAEEVKAVEKEVPEDVFSLGWQSTWLGDYLSFSNGWIYHTKIHWMYMHPDTKDGAWGYVTNYGWIWSSPRVYPYFYSNNTKEWIYFN
jgi:hypothetical protein